ncbi:MAG: hypothetical protein ACRDJG_06980, partial [Actinomycetota bacterium]
QSEFHLDRLQPGWLPTPGQQRLATLGPAISVGLIAGLLDGVAYGLIRGPVWGLLNGAAYGLFFGLFAGLRSTEPVEEVRWSWRRMRDGLRRGLVAGPVLGLLYGLPTALTVGLGPALFGLLFFGLFAGMIPGLATGMIPGLADKRNTPNEGIHRSARHALVAGLVAGLVSGLFFALVFELVFELDKGLGVGLRDGLIIGLLYAQIFGGLACLQHVIIRGLLAYHDFAPLRYTRFLDDATERLLLRRTGSGYIFIHRLLLEYFVSPKTSHPSSEAGWPARDSEDKESRL